MIARLFLWIDDQGKSHTIIAHSLSEVKQQLLLKGALFIAIKPKQRIYSSSFDKPALILLTRQLATMLKAGLPIIASLTLLIKEHRQLQWRHILQALKDGLLQGDPLSDLIKQQSLAFPTIYQQIITTAELTGRLEEGFANLAITLEKTYQQQQRIKKSLRYPLFLLLATLVVVIIMLLFVLPQFALIYQSFDAKLPAITQFMITLSELISQYSVILFITLIACRLSYRYYFVKRYQYYIEQTQLRLPIIGNLMINYYLSAIFQTLSLTEQSGIPLLSGLKTARNSINHKPFQRQLDAIVNDIEQGHSFNQALQPQNNFPFLVKQLIHIGEESGTLDEIFIQISQHYQQQYDEQTQRLTQKIEPLLMSLMAIIIGGLVIAIYLPIFQLGGVIH